MLFVSTIWRTYVIHHPCCTQQLKYLKALIDEESETVLELPLSIKGVGKLMTSAIPGLFLGEWIMIAT